MWQHTALGVCSLLLSVCLCVCIGKITGVLGVLYNPPEKGEDSKIRQSLEDWPRASATG